MAAKKRKAPAARPDDRADGPTIRQGDARSTGAAARRVALAIYGLFFAALLLTCSPLLDSKFALPKSVVLSAGVLSFGVLLLVRARRDGQVSSPPPALLLGLALAGWWVLSTPFALHLPTALFGEYDYYNGLYTHLCFLALFVVSMSLPLDTRAVRHIIAFLAASISIVAIVNVTETAGLTSMGLAEVSTLGDRVAAGALMNFAIPFVVVTLIRARRWDIRIAMGALLALLLASEFISQGRGPWLGLLVAMLILMAGLISARMRWQAGAALASGITALAVLAAALSPTIAQRFTSFTRLAQDESLGQRFVYYRAALRAIYEHPLAGIGFENFRNSYPHYRGPDDVWFFNNVIPTMVHNGYLETALNNGIAALLLYLALIGVVLFMLGREMKNATDPARRDLLLCCMAMICAYLVQDLSGWLDLGLAGVFWVTLGLAANQSRPAAAAGRNSAPHALSIVFAGVMTLVCVYLLSDGCARLRADSRLFQAQSLDVRTQWPEVESRVSSALAALPSDSRTEMMSAQLYANRFLATRDPAAYARSHALFQSSYGRNPFDRMRLVNVIALETNALRLGVTDKGSDFARQALQTLSQTDGDNPGFHEFKAQFFAAQGDFEQALAAMADALRLAPLNSHYREREAEYLRRTVAPAAVAR